MSVQVESAADTSRGSTGSTVLQKAVSFKNDIRLRITRTKSNLKSDGVTPKVGLNKKPVLVRSGSFSDGCKAEKIAKKTEVEMIKEKGRGVFQSLRYVQDVVDKGVLQQQTGSVTILQQLTGSVTILLEVVMDLDLFFKNIIVSSESTVLTSAYRAMHQSFADLTRCTDRVLLNYSTTDTVDSGMVEPTIDNAATNSAIATVKDAVQKLITLIEEKIASRSHSQSTACPATASVNKSVTLSDDRGNTHPLSVRESDTNPLGHCITSGLSQSVDNILDDSRDGATVRILDEPPPKPPLPRELNRQQLSWKCNSYLGTTTASAHEDDDDIPPPLPVKHRNSSSAVFDSQSSDIQTGSFSFNQRDSYKQSGSCTLSVPLSASLRQSSASSVCSSSLSMSSSDELIATGEPPPKPARPFSTSPRLLQTRVSQYDNVDEPEAVNQRITWQGPIQGQVLWNKPGKSLYKIEAMSGNLSEKWKCEFEEAHRMMKFKTDTMATCDEDGAYDCVDGEITRRDFHSVRIPAGFRCEQSEGLMMRSEIERGNQGNSSMLCVEAATAKLFRSSAPQEGFGCGVLQQNESYSMQERKSCATMYGTSGPTVLPSLECSSETLVSDSSAPPLPPKRRNVDAYMQVVGRGYSHPKISEMSRNSVSFYHCEWYRHKVEMLSLAEHPAGGSQSNRSSDLFSEHSTGSSNEESSLEALPPALPPKQSRSLSLIADKSLESGSSHSSSSYSCSNSSKIGNCGSQNSDSGISSSSSINSTSSSNSASNAVAGTSTVVLRRNHGKSMLVSENTKTKKVEAEEIENNMAAGGNKVNKVKEAELDTLDLLDVADQLIYKKTGEDGPELRGGSVDALIVQATAAAKLGQPTAVLLMYQEAFLSTYRTFISTSSLIDKLLQRYNKFSKSADVKKKKLSRNAFSLLVRVTDELCTETDEEILQILLGLVYQLLSDGELMLARTMRKKVLEKCEHHRMKQEASHHIRLLSAIHVTSKRNCITEFKSELIAQQMTLIDAHLFQKIEMPEVLLWSREQSEEHSPNLTQFTEHFNKMSYWCRTRILEKEEPKEREKVLMKFIKIMKHLRQLNNFNSYLAVLSAVDSAPVRRLEWAKQNVEALKEFSELIDSSASFRSYRQALSETEPPCIPYIGLVLQDLTFIHIGNKDKCPDGRINFAKCWQLFTVLDNMRRFKKCNYEIKKESRVVDFFNNFDDYLCEEALWQISEMIKPRPGKKLPKLSDS